MERVGLEQDADKRVADYSKGMKSRLNFIKALLHDPVLLCLDEPTSGLDPANSRMMKNMILEEKAKGKTILLTTHHMQDAVELCDRVAFIVNGKICALDSQLIDILFAMLSSTMFCFVSAMLSLEERDEKTAVYLFITPLRKTGNIVARFGVPSVIAFLATIILLPVFKLTSLSSTTILLLAAGGTLQGMIVALLVLTISSNKLEGMAVTKLSPWIPCQYARFQRNDW